MEIEIPDFLNALVGLFDPEEGMARRDKFLAGFLSDESAWRFLLEDLPTLAAVLSGVVGVSCLIDTDEFVSLMASGLPDDSTEATEVALVASTWVKPGDQREAVLRLLETLDSVQRVEFAVYLQEARRHEKRQEVSVSYELYRPVGSRR